MEPTSDSELLRMPIKLAFRAEGDFWNCYIVSVMAADDTMLLGSIALGTVQSTHVKKAFMHAMQLAMSQACVEVLGMNPFWGEPEPSPEHEIGGNA